MGNEIILGSISKVSIHTETGGYFSKSEGAHYYIICSAIANFLFLSGYMLNVYVVVGYCNGTVFCCLCWWLWCIANNLKSCIYNKLQCIFHTNGHYYILHPRLPYDCMSYEVK